MTPVPDFRNGAVCTQWRAAIQELGCPAHMTAQQWAQVIQDAEDAAVAAAETFYRTATQSRDTEVSSNAIMNGGELAKLMIANMQQSVLRYCENCGGGSRTFTFEGDATGTERGTVQ